MAIANLALRFLTELAGIAAVGYAAFQLSGPVALRSAAAIGAAAALIIAWGLVVAPNAANGLAQPHRDLIGTALLLAAAGALMATGQPGMAIGFSVVVVVNTVLLFALGTDARDGLAGMAR